MTSAAGLKSKIKTLWNSADGFANDTLWGTAGDMALLVSALFSFILVQEVLPRERFGSYAAMYAVIGPLGAMAYAGPGLALLQKRLRFNAPANPTLRRFLSLTLVQGAVLTMAATAIVLLVADDLSFFEVLFISATELILNSTVFVVSMLIQASTGYAAMIRVRLGAVLVRLTVVVGLASFDKTFSVDTGQLVRPQFPGVDKFEALTIFNLGAASLVGYGLYAAWLLRFHIPKHGYRVSFGKPDKETALAGARFALPMAASEFQTNGDKAALRGFGYAAENGIYSVAYRVVLLGLTPVKILDAAAFQRFLDDDVTKPGMHLRRSIRFAGLMLAAGLFSAAVLYLAQPWLGFLFAADKEEASEIIPWLIPIIPLVAVRTTPLNGLVGLGRETVRGAVLISSSALALVLYLIFIPPMGWPGAVIATMISEAYLALAAWYALFRYQRIADLANAEVATSPPAPEAEATLS